MTTESDIIGVCVQMKGSKCAGTFCDYWDDEEQKCALALECKMRVEILRNILEQSKEAAANKEDAESFQKMVRQLNIVEPTMTKH